MYKMLRSRAVVVVVVLACLVTGCANPLTDDAGASKARQAQSKKDKERQLNYWEIEKKTKSGQKPTSVNKETDLSKIATDLSYKQDLLVSPDGNWAVLVGSTSRSNEGDNKQNQKTDKLVLVNLKEGQGTVLYSGQNIRIKGWADNSQQVLYSEDGLYLVNIASSQTRQISTTAQIASISADGRNVAYIEPNEGLFVAEVAKPGARLLVKGVAQQQLLWYPDNRRILFWKEEQGDSLQLTRVYMGGSGEKALVKAVKGTQLKPWWLVNNEQVVIQGKVEAKDTCWVMDLVQRKATQVKSNILDSSLKASILVNQKEAKVIFAGLGRLDEYNAQGQLVRQKQLDDGSFHNYDYSYSPDGQKFCYLYGSPGDKKLNEIAGRKVWFKDLTANSSYSVTPSYGKYFSPQWLGNDQLVFLEDEATKEGHSLKLWVVKAGSQ